MITLFQFPRAFDVPNPSPFCLKVETFLRLTGLEYQVKAVANPGKGPKGKLPFIKLDAEVIADSAIILRSLSERLGLTLDSHLDAAGRGRSLAITRLCDEHLAPLMVYFRWLDDEGWAQVKPAFFGRLPAPLRLLVPRLVQGKIRKSLQAQGLGRHNRDELLTFAREDLQALSDLLGAAPYFGGVQPCSADAAAYGVLANLILCTVQTPLGRLAREFPSLVAYCERLRDKFWA
ncbi:glutathione S-transferase family protein [Pseudomonas cavernae]|uniref:Glutathione S-transferase family protein n=1 Tax=Pseudomonas cavernae TaxID=2320867 RepID=A0A385Z132_9PSED|nr:glutathione S-transferase family protein [Pseudomonas cavernae]AYC31917.1 glutathione S-transferase family protein [Pseudomonas cavernae]